MKKLLLFVAAFPLFVSCSDQEPIENAPFFYLTEGNMWVYKRYVSDNNGQNPVPNGQTDTVRVVSQELIEGVSNYKLTHSLGDSVEYQRIDEQGHLVNPAGIVIHPGRDDEYTTTNDYTIEGEVLGTIDYSSDDDYTGTVEGHDYILYPFRGYFTPVQGNIPEGIASISAYQPLIGMAFFRCRYLATQAYYEDRLVYYELI